MTSTQQKKVETALNHRHYKEYRKDMWCKPIGMLLFCFDFEKMELYWLADNKTGDRIKVRANTSTEKLVAVIKEYEKTFYSCKHEYT